MKINSFQTVKRIDGGVEIADEETGQRVVLRSEHCVQWLIAALGAVQPTQALERYILTSLINDLLTLHSASGDCLTCDEEGGLLGRCQTADHLVEAKEFLDDVVAAHV